MAQDGWGDFTFAHLLDVKYSDCRDLVEVEGGIEWNIRRLIDKFPEVCWKYPCTTSIARYHYDTAKLAEEDVVTRANCSTHLPLFYATLPHIVSPIEISVQPAFLAKVRKNMSERLSNAYANVPNLCGFSDDQFMPQIPCGFRSSQGWRRAKVMRICGDENILVELVDFGTAQFAPRDALFPLPRSFGRVPPLVLKCRINNCYANDLNTEKMERFNAVIEDCRNLVQVELLTTAEPYLVNLFHPTVVGLDIGKEFTRPMDSAQREEAKVRRWNDHVRRENCDNDSDFDSDDDDYEGEFSEEELPPQFIRSFDRAGKACRAGDADLFVGHIENTRLVYLHTQWMLDTRARIEKSISDEFASLPPLPSSWRCCSTACAVSHSNGYSRATIEQVLPTDQEQQQLELLLVDRGIHVICNTDNVRILPEQELYCEQPLLHVIGLNKFVAHYPHPTETAILRDLLPEGSKVQFKADRHYKRVPMRGDLLFGENCFSATDQLESRLSSKRVDVECKALIPFVHTEYHDNVRADLSFTHRTTCPTSLLKGNLTIEAL